MISRSALAPLLALLAALAWCAPASADVFGPIELLSDGVVAAEEGQGQLQQALYAHDPVVSQDGRYVAFDGYFGGRTGVWRRDLQTGQVLPVAVGPKVQGGESCVQAVCDAELPSISANGQYVSFTTTAALEPALDTNSAPDVYVRDMAVAETQTCNEASPEPSQPCPFTLASAVNGKAEGLSYEGGIGYGSTASGRSALSADGQKVAFVTTAVSDLAGPGTPALQVALRNIATRETELVSVRRDPGTGLAEPGVPVHSEESGASYGAVFSAASSPPPFPYSNRAYSLTPAVGASLSADGTTVAWMARNVSLQVKTLAQERTASYTEPLWRRVADGPLTPTRRITGGSEPEAPGCAASGEAELPRPEQASTADPCQGPFAVESTFGVWSGSRANVVPQLSADGYTVAFIATAPRVTLGVDFGRGSETEESDLYLSDMHPGVSRVQALTPLTELASGKVGFEPGNAPVVDVGISPDGRQVAFATRRTEFPLGAPAYVSTTAAVSGMAELFDVDLSGDTLTRVTNGYEGGPAEHPHKVVKATEEPYEVVDGAQSPSFSADGNLLVFASTASNLVYGDGNTPPVGVESRGGSADGSDVFDVTRKLFPAVAAQGYVSPAPPNPAVEPEWRVGVTAGSLSDGSVELYIQTPGAGTATVTASSTVPAPAAQAGRSKGKRARRAATRVAPAVLRTVAGAHAAAGSSTLLKVRLTLARGYQPLAARSGGLYGTVRVSFTAPGHPAVFETVAVTFSGHAVVARRAKHRARRTVRK